MTNDVDRGASDVEQVIAGQRRRRRLRFWLGFAAITVLGGLWAGLTTDPLGPGIFGDDVIFDAPAAEVVEFEDFDVPTTTTMPQTTAVPEATTPATSAPTTAGP